MIQFIVSDLDGTLLNEKRQLSNRTIAAIRCVQKNKIRLLINTELDYLEARNVLDNADIHCDIACFGGACIFRSNGEKYHAAYLPLKTVPEMLRLFGKHRTFYEIHSTKGLCVLGTKEGYTNYLEKEAAPLLTQEELSTLSVSEWIQRRISQTQFYDTGKKLFEEHSEIIKISSRSKDSEKLSNLAQELQCQVPEFVVSNFDGCRIDVTAAEALKGAALKYYAESHQLSLKETLVIGDSENDYSMLALPYVESVAMGNADPVIQEICLHHTASNTEDGAALVLEQVLSRNMPERI